MRGIETFISKENLPMR